MVARRTGALAFTPYTDWRATSARAAVAAADHRLGTENTCARRIGAALDRYVGDVSQVRVPLASIGAAIAATTGGRYDDADPDDRDLAARIVVVLATRIAVVGFDVAEVPDLPGPRARVLVRRCPARAVMRPRGWAEVASRVELARWARRAPAPVPEPAPVGAASAPADERVPGDEAARLRAAGQWPPPVLAHGGGPQSRTPGGAAVWREPVRLRGCAGGRDGIACVVLRGRTWRCPECGTPTLAADGVVGPQLPVCVCAGDRAVCLHPPGTAGPTRPPEPDPPAPPVRASGTRRAR